MKRQPYFKEIDWDKVMKKELGRIEIEKRQEQRAKRIPERAHNITKAEIIKDDKREMKNCVRNFFYIITDTNTINISSKHINFAKHFFAISNCHFFVSLVILSYKSL